MFRMVSGILQDSMNVTVCTSNIDLSPSLSLSWARLALSIKQKGSKATFLIGGLDNMPTSGTELIKMPDTEQKN